MRSKRIWALVADNAKARIVADLHSDNSSEQTIVAPKPKLAREIMADKPGRSHSSVGTRRSAMEYHSDPERLRDRDFAVFVAETFAGALRDGKAEGAVIVAPPKMLGDLREAMPDAARRLVVAEIAKDLTKLQPAALAKRIREAI